MRQRKLPVLFLFLLILCLCYGGSGGAHEPIRILAVVLSPWAFAKLSYPSYYRELKPVICFFIFWLGYMFLSLLWSSDPSRGLGEIVYYVIHFLLFLEIIVFAKQCVNRYDIISLAWMFAFLLTSIVAMWELRTGHHLASALQDSDLVASTGRSSMRVVFASANFGNYNTYSTFICFALPFCFYNIVQGRTVYRFFGIISILLSTSILFFNASRGSLVALFIMMVTFLLFNLKVQKNKKAAGYLIILLTAVLLLFSFYGAQILEHILFRLEGSDLYEDTRRTGIWTDALELFLSTGGIGIGVGSLGQSMHEIGHTVTHNVFFEILVQYGFVITFVIAVFLIQIFLRFYHCSERFIKMLGYCALLAFPFFAIIDSSYMLKPQIWVFIASLYVFSNKKISHV